MNSRKIKRLFSKNDDENLKGEQNRKLLGFNTNELNSKTNKNKSKFV